MLWIVRTCRHVPRQPSRSFSLTPNYRLPRIVPRRDTRHAHHTHKPESTADERPQQGPSTESPPGGETKPPTATNQVLFVVAGSLIAFGVAARLTNVDTYDWTNKVVESDIAWLSRTPNNGELRRARYYELGKRLQASLNRLAEAASGLPQDIRAMVVYAYTQLAQSALNTTEGARVCYGLAATHGLVWLAWQIPRLDPFMTRHFTHHPLSGLSYTLLTSVFSHSSFLHMLFNTMALMSFGPIASLYLTREQQNDSTYLRESTSQWHFLALYVSAGLSASVASHLYATRIMYPRLAAKLAAAPASAAAPIANAATSAVSATTAETAASAAEAITSVIKPSLGASGAIYATVTMTAMAFPDQHITLLFPPTPPIPIQYGVFGLMAVDVLGLLRGWRLFDHTAHLGGALFGLWYYRYGVEYWQTFRERTLGSLPRSLRGQ